MEDLTFDRAVELAREVVAEFGKDYAYPSEDKVFDPEIEVYVCVYVQDEKPSCLVGQILHRHGVSLEELSRHEFKASTQMAFLVTGLDDKANQFLAMVQSFQDKGWSWAASVDKAVEYTK